MNELKELSKEIREFLDEYAKISANYDPEVDADYEKYNSPDGSMMRYYADQLSNNVIPDVPLFSEWGQGGYGPYSSREGREKHDEIIKKINQLKNGRKYN